MSAHSREEPPFPPPSNDLEATREIIKKYQEIFGKKCANVGELREGAKCAHQLRANVAGSTNEDVKRESEEALMSLTQKWIRAKKQELAEKQRGDTPMADAPSVVPKWPKRKTLQEIEWEEEEGPPYSFTEDDLEDCGAELPFKDPATGETYKWVTSKKASKITEHLLDESLARDPDVFDMYINKDWYPYALMEVLENWIADWLHEYKKVHPRPEELFFKVEGLLIFNALGYGIWHMAGDGERIEALDLLISELIATTFRVLDEQHLIHRKSPIRNIGLVAALATKWHNKDLVPVELFEEILGRCLVYGITPSLGPLELEVDQALDPYLERWEEINVGPKDDKEDILQAIEDYLDGPAPNPKLGGKRFDLKRLTKEQRERIEGSGGSEVIFGGRMFY